MAKKIILGTAQSISGYGVTNTKETVDMHKLLNSFYILGGRDIDTAPDYANAEKIIGVDSNLFNVTTKIPSIHDLSKKDYIQQASDSIKKSMNNLKLSSIDNLLIHDVGSFIENFNDDVRKFIESLKDNGVIKNFGASVYSPKELEQLMNLISIDLVQFPLNPFNQVFISQNFLKKLNLQGISTYARSIYMQGLLVTEKYKSIPYFNKWSRNFESWFEFCRVQEISSPQACLAFIDSIDFLDGYVVGVTSPEELSELYHDRSVLKGGQFNQFAVNEGGLIDPRKWI